MQIQQTASTLAVQTTSATARPTTADDPTSGTTSRSASASVAPVNAGGPASVAANSAGGNATSGISGPKAAAIKQLKQLIEELQRQLSELHAQITRESHLSANDTAGASGEALMTLTGQATGIESALQIAMGELVQMMAGPGMTTGLINDTA